MTVASVEPEAVEEHRNGAGDELDVCRDSEIGNDGLDPPESEIATDPIEHDEPLFVARRRRQRRVATSPREL